MSDKILEMFAANKIRSLIPDTNAIITIHADGIENQVHVKNRYGREQFFSVRLICERYAKYSEDVADTMMIDELAMYGFRLGSAFVSTGPKTFDTSAATKPGFMPEPGSPEDDARRLSKDNLPPEPVRVSGENVD